MMQLFIAIWGLGPNNRRLNPQHHFPHPPTSRRDIPGASRKHASITDQNLFPSIPLSCPLPTAMSIKAVRNAPREAQRLNFDIILTSQVQPCFAHRPDRVYSTRQFLFSSLACYCFWGRITLQQILTFCTCLPANCDGFTRRSHTALATLSRPHVRTLRDVSALVIFSVARPR
jgi:hypothetical protein